MTDNLKPFKKGDPRINREGRPVGSISVIARIKKEFREHPEKFEEFLDRYLNNKQNEKHIAEMIDGKPFQKMDMTSKGEKIAFIPSELMEKYEIDTSTESDSEGHS